MCGEKWPSVPSISCRKSQSRAAKSHISCVMTREQAAPILLLWCQVSYSGGIKPQTALALIGCLLILNFMLRFPELGAVIAQYNQF
jgi:hypothetical protein